MAQKPTLRLFRKTLKKEVERMMEEEEKECLLRLETMKAGGGIAIEDKEFARVLIICKAGNCSDPEGVLEQTWKAVFPQAELRRPVIDNEEFYRPVIEIYRVLLGKDEDILAGKGEEILLLKAARRALITKKDPSSAEKIRGFIDSVILSS